VGDEQGLIWNFNSTRYQCREGLVSLQERIAETEQVEREKGRAESGSHRELQEEAQQEFRRVGRNDHHHAQGNFIACLFRGCEHT